MKDVVAGKGRDGGEVYPLTIDLFAAHLSLQYAREQVADVRAA
jgi:hypothetical protein